MRATRLGTPTRSDESALLRGHSVVSQDHSVADDIDEPQEEPQKHAEAKEYVTQKPPPAEVDDEFAERQIRLQQENI